VTSVPLSSDGPDLPQRLWLPWHPGLGPDVSVRLVVGMRWDEEPLGWDEMGEEPLGWDEEPLGRDEKPLGRDEELLGQDEML